MLSVMQNGDIFYLWYRTHRRMHTHEHIDRLRAMSSIKMIYLCGVCKKDIYK